MRLGHAARRSCAGLLGVIAILTGLGQAIDESAMFLESAFFVTAAVRR